MAVNKKKEYEAEVRNAAQVMLSKRELEEPYSMREIDQLLRASDERSGAFHANLIDKMDSFEAQSQEQWDRIEAQTSKTNGYVADLIRWKWIFVGFGTCITVIVLPTLWALIQAGKF